MRVGFIADKVPYKARRGWGVYAYHLLNALFAIDRENTYRCFYNIFRKGDMSCLVPTDGADAVNRVWRVPGRAMSLLWEAPRILPAEFFLGSIDLLHVPYEFLPKVKRARTVVTVHDVSFLKHPELLDPEFVRLWTRRIENVVERADRIIADSDNTKKELVELAGASADCIRTVPLGVDSSFMAAAQGRPAADVLAGYGISSPYILFVGAADEDKNLLRLARAFARLRNEHRDLQLVLAGKSSWGFDQMMAKLREENLQDGVVLTGYVLAEDMPSLYASSEVLAMPSIHEGFGLPVLEAMASGTAVLASDAASLPEVVGDAGLLVDPLSVDSIADGLRKLLDDSELQSTCVSRGLERAKQFTWEATARGVLDVYSELER